MGPSGKISPGGLEKIEICNRRSCYPRPVRDRLAGGIGQTGPGWGSGCCWGTGRFSLSTVEALALRYQLPNPFFGGLKPRFKVMPESTVPVEGLGFQRSFYLGLCARKQKDRRAQRAGRADALSDVCPACSVRDLKSCTKHCLCVGATRARAKRHDALIRRAISARLIIGEYGPQRTQQFCPAAAARRFRGCRGLVLAARHV